MSTRNHLIKEERGFVPRILLAGIVVLVLGAIGFAGWKVAGNSINAKAAGYFEVQDTEDVYIGACKVKINEDSSQIGLKVINDSDKTAALETRVYGSGATIKSFSVPAKSTNYPARYITSQSMIVISANGSSVSVPVASLPGC